MPIYTIDGLPILHDGLVGVSEACCCDGVCCACCPAITVIVSHQDVQQGGCCPEWASLYEGIPPIVLDFPCDKILSLTGGIYRCCNYDYLAYSNDGMGGTLSLGDEYLLPRSMLAWSFAQVDGSCGYCDVIYGEVFVNTSYCYNLLTQKCEVNLSWGGDVIYDCGTFTFPSHVQTTLRGVLSPQTCVSGRTIFGPYFGGGSVTPAGDPCTFGTYKLQADWVFSECPGAPCF